MKTESQILKCLVQHFFLTSNDLNGMIRLLSRWTPLQAIFKNFGLKILFLKSSRMPVNFFRNLGHKNMRSLKRVYATVAFKTPAEARQKRLHFFKFFQLYSFSFFSPCFISLLFSEKRSELILNEFWIRVNHYLMTQAANPYVLTQIPENWTLKNNQIASLILNK